MHNVTSVAVEPFIGRKSGLSADVDPEVKNFITEMTGEAAGRELLWLNTKLKKELSRISAGHTGIVNLQRVNDIRRINKYLEEANRQLYTGGYNVICMEAKNSRKKRILNKFHPWIAWPYYTLDFILKRAFPKWKYTRKLYFMITGGRNRVISITEGLGRLASCGFEIVGYRTFGYLTYIVSRKVSDPAYDMAPTYGMFITLKRIGKDGRMVPVKKLRTMHPYSEYLQEFVYENNSLAKGGKLKNDFRMTGWGRLFRRYWIDELPMLVNWLKRDMKLVGVRPVSAHYLSLYPEDVREIRQKVKPGLIPPFYADLPETIEEIAESEKQYVEAYLEKPFTTDLKYLWLILFNIVVRKARSR